MRSKRAATANAIERLIKDHQLVRYTSPRRRGPRVWRSYCSCGWECERPFAKGHYFVEDQADRHLRQQIARVLSEQ